jgi:hypothetical protein
MPTIVDVHGAQHAVPTTARDARAHDNSNPSGTAKMRSSEADRIAARQPHAVAEYVSVGQVPRGVLLGVGRIG